MVKITFPVIIILSILFSIALIVVAVLLPDDSYKYIAYGVLGILAFGLIIVYPLFIHRVTNQVRMTDEAFRTSQEREILSGRNGKILAGIAIFWIIISLFFISKSGRTVAILPGIAFLMISWSLLANRRLKLAKLREKKSFRFERMIIVVVLIFWILGQILDIWILNGETADIISVIGYCALIFYVALHILRECNESRRKFNDGGGGGGASAG